MYSFFTALAVLILGYVVYGKYVTKVFGVSNKQTPAYTNKDGIDYIPMPTWKVFLIQFLNIAGLGPIFGAIMGIQYGPAAFIWISVGTIFGGAVHDYLSGMISLREKGLSLPDIVGDQLGKRMKGVMSIFSILLLVLVGAVFVINPANLLANLTNNFFSINTWVIIIFGYYMLATLLPIDKLIGNIYPVFGFALLFMAAGLFVMILFNLEYIPEFTSGLQNRFPNPEQNAIFPMMFVSIACGAISGFHATQSPMMARCLKQEKYGYAVFYGAMVAEGIVALIWAAATIAFFKGDFNNLTEALVASKNAAPIVNEISVSWLGTIGGILAILGVVAAPITTGDTALRSCRLIVADMFKIDQIKIWKRLLTSLPIFAMAYVIMQIDFTILWRYMGWSNQTLAVFTLWAVTVYLARNNKQYLIGLIPSLFMTMVSVSYILYAPEGVHLGGLIGNLISYKGDIIELNYTIALSVAGVITLALFILFMKNVKRLRQKTDI